MRDLTYNGVTLPAYMVEELVKQAGVLNVPPSYLIVKLHYEGIWGKSEVARKNNNWSGMTWTGEPQRPSGVVVTLGSARPANEGGYYMRYATLDDFFKDWLYLIRRGGPYKVADSPDFPNAVSGMFKAGGATYDYATMKLVGNDLATSQKRFELYLHGMKARRAAINNANNGFLDVLDNERGKGMAVSIKQVLDQARAELGTIKGSAKHKKIVSDYNKVSPLPVDYALKVSDDWCDGFVTVISDRAGATNLIGRECGVERHKNIFKQKNIWNQLQTSGNTFQPQAGDIVIFRWDGKRFGFAHHIGFVERVSGDNITTIEGNTFQGGVSKVGRNTFHKYDKNIQGYARPKYGNVKPKAFTKEVAQHFVVTIDSLRAFQEPTATSKLVENIKKDYVKNIDVTVESEGYLWGGWISSADGKRRYTTLKDLRDGRTFVELKEGTIPHGGKTYTEYLETQNNSKLADNQDVGGDKPRELKDNEFRIDGVIYEVSKK